MHTVVFAGSPQSAFGHLKPPYSRREKSSFYFLWLSIVSASTHSHQERHNITFKLLTKNVLETTGPRMHGT